MSTEIISRKRGLVTDEELNDQARRAVATFRKLQPTLTSYARVLSKNPRVRVDMAARDNGSTDGTRIFYRPPLALGDRTPHDRARCDKRDENGLMRCDACAIREAVLTTIYHEIAHICFDSFMRTTDDDRRRAVEFAIKEAGGKWAKQIAEKINSAPSYKTGSYIGLSSLINEFLPFLVNCLEDARVNAELFKARPGVRRMFHADTHRIFREGYECMGPDGKPYTQSWHEAPLNSQIMVGVFCKASGYDYANWFHPQVVEHLNDPELTNLVRSMDTVRNAGAVYNLAFKVLARLRDLGYCGTPQDPDSEPEPETEENKDHAGTDKSSSTDSEGDQQDPTSDGASDQESGSGEDDNSATDDNRVDAAGDSRSDEDMDESGVSPSEPSDPQEDGNSPDGSGVDDEQGTDPSDSEAGTPDSHPVPEGSEPADSPEPPDASSGDGEATPEASDPHDAGSAEEGEPHAGSSEGESEEVDGAEVQPGDSPPGDSESDSGEGASEDRAEEADDDRDIPPSPASDNTDDAEGSDDSDRDYSPKGSDGGESDDAGSDEDYGSGQADTDGDPSSADEHSGDPVDDSPTGDVPVEQSEPSVDPADDDSDGTGSESSAGSGPAGTGHDLDGVDSSEGTPEVTGFRGSGDLGLDVPEESSTLDSDSGDESDPEGSSDTPLGQADPAQDDAEGDMEAIDSGADDGYGGTSLIGEEDEGGPLPDYGTPEEVEPILLKWGDHEEKPKSVDMEEAEAAVDQAIIQGIYFTKPSVNIGGVREHFWGKPVIVAGQDTSDAWKEPVSREAGVRKGQIADTDVPEIVLQPALLAMRRAFSDNRRGATQVGKKSGKINARALGKRAPVGDPRLFYKRTMPGKKDYFVVIGMDISGSTNGKNLALEKRAIMAQAELLSRMGVEFSIYAHTGNYSLRSNRSAGLDLDVYHIKDPGEKWTPEVQRRLETIRPSAANLDGHAMEFLRKRLDERNETDRILLYYSDGKMPAENHDEELDILTSEIRICRAKGYTLLGVGIRTDSPVRHGLDTVEVHEDEDLMKVVKQLGKRLAVKV